MGFGIENNAGSDARPGWAGSEGGIVAFGGASSDEYAIDATPQTMGDGAGLIAGDPAAFAAAGGNFTIECHGPFGNDPGSPLGDSHEIGRV